MKRNLLLAALSIMTVASTSAAFADGECKAMECAKKVGKGVLWAPKKLGEGMVKGVKAMGNGAKKLVGKG